MEPVAAGEVAVAATRIPLAGLACLLTLPVSAAILPEQRADALYHSYDGGGVTVDGPSLLVRKNFKETISVSGNYYVDNISSASIDVVGSESPHGTIRPKAPRSGSTFNA